MMRTVTRLLAVSSRAANGPLASGGQNPRDNCLILPNENGSSGWLQEVRFVCKAQSWAQPATEHQKDKLCLGMLYLRVGRHSGLWPDGKGGVALSQEVGAERPKMTRSPFLGMPVPTQSHTGHTGWDIGWW